MRDRGLPLVGAEPISTKIEPANQLRQVRSSRAAKSDAVDPTLQELIDACPEAAESIPEDLRDRLLEILAGQWVIPLKDAAQKMAVPETELAKLAIEAPEMTGLLAGPPAILFLNPEAVGRQ